MSSAFPIPLAPLLALRLKCVNIPCFQYNLSFSASVIHVFGIVKYIKVNIINILLKKASIPFSHPGVIGFASADSSALDCCFLTFLLTCDLAYLPRQEIHLAL